MKSAGDKHSDGGELYLHAKVAGKYWRLAYRFESKQKILALGVHPAITLAQTTVVETMPAHCAA